MEPADDVAEAEELRTSLESAWETGVEALPRVGIAVGVLVAFIVTGRLLRPLVRRALRRRRTPSFANVFARLAQSGMTLLGVLLAITVVFPSVRPVDVLAGAGLLTVAAGFAFQDVLSNLLAGLVLLFRQPFVGGDQIHVEEVSGTVQEINIRETVIRSFDGRKLVVPNSKVYAAVISVQTGYAAIRTTFTVGVAYESDLELARRTALTALAAVPGVLDQPAPEAQYSQLGTSTVDLDVRYWTTPLQHHLLDVRDRAIEAVKRGMDEAGIEMPVELLALQATSSFEAALRGRPVTPGGSVARAEEHVEVVGGAGSDS